MGFFGDMVSAVTGAIAKVANAISGAVSSLASAIESKVSSMASAVSEVVDGAEAMIADACEDLEADSEELIEESYKLLVGASIWAFGSSSPKDESQGHEDDLLDIHKLK